MSSDPSPSSDHSSSVRNGIMGWKQLEQIAQHNPKRLRRTPPRDSSFSVSWPSRGTSRRPRTTRSCTAGRRRRRSDSHRRAGRTRRPTSCEPGQHPGVLGSRIARGSHRSPERRVTPMCSTANRNGVPELVAEAARGVDPLLVERDVVTRRRRLQQRQPNGIGAVLARPARADRGRCRATSTSCARPSSAPDRG